MKARTRVRITTLLELVGLGLFVIAAAHFSRGLALFVAGVALFLISFTLSGRSRGE